MWLLLALGSAVGAGTADALVKHAVKTERVPTLSLVRAGWGAVFLLPFLFFGGLPKNHAAFWVPIALAMPLEVLASLSYQKALQISPLSLTVPYLAFTPVFLLGMGWIVLGEVPSGMGIAGVASVTAGAIFIQGQGGLKRPSKGSFIMLGVAFLYSITSVLAKKALLASTPFTFAPIYYTCLAVGLLPFQGISLRGSGREMLSRPGLFASIGAIEAAVFLMQFTALLTAGVAYVVAIKRLSLLLAVLYGRLFFEERHLFERLAGAFLMFVGACLIAFA